MSEPEETKKAETEVPPVAEQIAEITSDSTLGWGRAGQVESFAGRGDTSAIPLGAGIALTESITATAPNTFRPPARPVPNCSEGLWNMDEIARNTKLGG